MSYILNKLHTNYEYNNVGPNSIAGKFYFLQSQLFISEFLKNEGHAHVQILWISFWYTLSEK